MKRRAFMGCLLACVLMMAQIAVAAEVTLQASKDNTLFEEATVSNGSGMHMFVGKAGAMLNQQIRRGVITFNVAGSVPAGATINRVILTLNMSRTNPSAVSRTVMLHRLLQDWGEGTSDAGLNPDGPGGEGSGSPSTSGDATWVHTFFNTRTWNKPGGDFFPTASASRNIVDTGLYSWDSNSLGNAGMLNDVQAWLDGTAGNFGWLLRGDETTPASVKQFDTKEAATRPQLQVFFTPNQPPVAVNDTNVTTPEDMPITINVLSNDIDADNDSLTITSVTQGTHGTVINNTISVTYTPNANFNGTDTFTYTPSDGIVPATVPATVTVTVTPVNDPPLANDDAAGTLVNTAVTIDVLSNDNDIDNDTRSVSAVTQGANGTVVNNTTNVTYTPNANFSGTDTFTYTLSDGKLTAPPATVTIKVSATPNTKPVAVNDAQRTPAGTAVTIDVLRNDSDADGDPLTVTSVTQGSNGTVVNNKINVTYTPRANFSGTDTFTYTLSDGIDTVTATVTITIFTLQRQLTVTKTGAGAGEGTVTSSPPGIACGATCSAQYDNGTAVTLTAVTNTSAVFIGWSGGGCSGSRTCTVSMTQDTTVTATFAQNLRPLADAGPDQEVDESLEGLPSLVTLDGSASTDPDGTIASYLWTQTEGPPVVLNDATIAKPTFTAPTVGALEAFAPGDHVPGFVLSPFPGGVTPEIQAHGTYANGQWTIMFTRPLMTLDADGDVQFDFTNPANTYLFSIAYLDNTGAAPPMADAAAVMSTQDTRAYTLGNASSAANLRAVQETPRDCSAFTGAPLQTRPASPAVIPALTLRAAYDRANIYLCVEAPDPNRQADEEKELWEFVGPAPTNWQRLPGSVNVMGGRAGAFDEDRLALWWNINAQDFATQGCAALCHDGRMRSRNADGRADLWYWQAARTNPVGFAEDQRLDPDKARCPDTPCRQLDADTLPIARANIRSFDAVTLPAYVAHAAPEANVRFLIDGVVPPQCPDETCAPAVLAALMDEPLTFELTVTDNQGLRSAPDSVTITVRDVDRDADSDGVLDTVENAAPNNGDGNNDGILDSLQPNVTSLPNLVNQGYITLVSPPGTALADVRFLRNPPAAAPTDLRFPWGFLVFTVLDVPPGSAITVTLLPPPNTALAADAFYFKFGPTPETPGDHFYRFTFDGTTGAEIFPDRIQLRLIDGARGDHDLAANGRITDPGAVAIAAPPLPTVARDSGGGGGCSILPGGQRTHSRPGDALGNILLPVLALLILYGWGRVTARATLQRFFRAASRSKPPGVDGSGRSSQR